MVDTYKPWSSQFLMFCEAWILLSIFSSHCKTVFSDLKSIPVIFFMNISLALVLMGARNGRSIPVIVLLMLYNLVINYTSGHLLDMSNRIINDQIWFNYCNVLWALVFLVIYQTSIKLYFAHPWTESTHTTYAQENWEESAMRQEHPLCFLSLGSFGCV